MRKFIMYKRVIEKIEGFLKKAIEYLKSVTLWSTSLSIPEGESPSEMMESIITYLQDLHDDIYDAKKTNNLSRKICNKWISKIIFLRVILKKIDFGKHVINKEQSLRELVRAEKFLIELRDDM